MNLSGKVALVTGGAKRVGRATALSLAEAGCDVAITYRASKGAAAELVGMIEAMGRRAWALQADLAETAAIEPFSEQLLERTGRLDVLVHNASVFNPTHWGELDAASWQRQMTVNALSPVLLTQALRQALAADEGGRVVHFVDIHVMGRPRRGYAAYNASKAALAEMTATLAVEMAPRVTVNAVAPGVVAWAEGMSERERQAYLARVPLERPGTPEEAAKTVLYLARDAEYTTGQTIRVDGGRWLA